MAKIKYKIKYDGGWLPHWGVDIEPLVDNNVVMLCRNDFPLSFSTTAIGGFIVLVNNYVHFETSNNTATSWVFDPTISNYPSYPDVNGNGYETHVVIVKPKVIGNKITNFSNAYTSYKLGNYLSGLLWIILDVHDFGPTYVGASVLLGDTVCQNLMFLEKVHVESGCATYNRNSFLGVGLIEWTGNLTVSKHHSTATAYDFTMFIISKPNCKVIQYKKRNDISHIDGTFRYNHNLRRLGLSGYYPNLISCNAALEQCYSYNEDLNLDAPLLYYFNNTNMRAIKKIIFTRSSFFNPIGPVICFTIVNALAMTAQALTDMLMSIYNYEVIENERVFTGKTFNISGCEGSQSTDPTYLATIDLFIAAGATIVR
jgi:hypothetical protein